MDRLWNSQRWIDYENSLSIVADDFSIVDDYRNNTSNMLTHVLYIWFLIIYIVLCNYSTVISVKSDTNLKFFFYQNKQIVRLFSAKKKKMVKWE